MELSVIIVNYHSQQPLMSCLRALATEAISMAHEIVLVDNSPGDGTAEAVAAQFPSVRVIANSDNVGFARAVNQGIRATSGALVLMLNPDCELRQGALGRLVTWLGRHLDCAIAGPRILNPDGSLEFSARGYPGALTFLFNRYSLMTRLWPGNPWSRRYLLSDWDHQSPRDVDWLSGACMLVRRAAIDAVGALDEAFFMFNEDVDWCRRMNLAGWRVSYVPEAVAVHHIGASRHRVSSRVIWERHRGMAHYFRKHHPTVAPLAAMADALIMTRASLMLLQNAFKPQ